MLYFSADVPNILAVVIASIRTTEIQIQHTSVHVVDVEHPLATSVLILLQFQGCPDQLVHDSPPPNQKKRLSENREPLRKGRKTL
jgi:hypothetical protein